MGTPPPIEVANLGMWDSLILMVLALVVFGPRRLPQIGRQIGKLMYEFRKASNDFKFQMEEELRLAEDSDRRKKEEERLRALAPQAQAPAETIGAPSVASAAENPYPDEVIYPPVIAAAPEAPAEEPYPRIQPPATGEPVPAALPGSRAAQVEVQPEAAEEKTPEAGPEAGFNANPGANAATGPTAGAVPEEARAGQTSPVTEQALHG
ncbi:MAG TPA: twin-arginine translocase TatA/TatE family subunit [Terracidiphilus sp.]|nr:twin-arginine translocase TatA/TatE family subunit [Terracidiphilus sp.]